MFDRAPRVAHTILSLTWEQCIAILCSKAVFHPERTIYTVGIFEVWLPHIEMKEILFRIRRDIVDTTGVIYQSCGYGAKLVTTIQFSKQNDLVVSGVANIKKDKITSLGILRPCAPVYESLVATLVSDPRRVVLCLLA